jgi:AcrR family transcriptional regulator
VAIGTEAMKPDHRRARRVARLHLDRLQRLRHGGEILAERRLDEMTAGHLESAAFMTRGHSIRAQRSRPPRRMRRALVPQAKNERRAAIVAAAHALLHRHPSADFPVEALARRAGLAKGTVYLYFRTREEVLLALHEQQSHALFDVVEQALASPGADARSVLAAGMGYMRAHPEFYPLAGNCRGMLDTNISTQAALEFKIGIGRRLAAIGSLIEKLYPGFAAGEGAALLMNSYALIIGLWQLADTPIALRSAMDRPDMAIFRMDYEHQLTAALLDLWESAERRGAQRQP